MQLVLAALGLLLTRTQMYLSGPLASGLIQGAQRLATLAQQQGVNTAEVRGQRCLGFLVGMCRCRPCVVIVHVGCVFS
jgi:hypothetical protein